MTLEEFKFGFQTLTTRFPEIYTLKRMNDLHDIVIEMPYSWFANRINHVIRTEDTKFKWSEAVKAYHRNKTAEINTQAMLRDMEEKHANRDPEALGRYLKSVGAQSASEALDIELKRIREGKSA